MITKPCVKCDGEGTLPSKAFLEWYRYSEDWPKEWKEHFHSMHPWRICPECEESGEKGYDDLEVYMKGLIDRWEEETGFSSRIEVDHPCFRSLLSLGSDIIPFILKKMQRELTWVMIALYKVVPEEDLPNIPEEFAGKIREQTEIWIKWGIEKGYLKEEEVDYVMYSDGACQGNPGPGAYGAIMQYKEGEKTFCQAYKQTTNNRMELLGVIEPIETIPRSSHIIIYTDSQYVAHAINKGWLGGWKKKGWKKAKGGNVLNVDLWKRMLPLLRFHTLEFRWIRGHNNNEYNERCDRMAVEAIEQTPENCRLPDKGYDGIKNGNRKET